MPVYLLGEPKKADLIHFPISTQFGWLPVQLAELLMSVNIGRIPRIYFSVTWLPNQQKPTIKDISSKLRDIYLLQNVRFSEVSSKAARMLISASYIKPTLELEKEPSQHGPNAT